MMYTLTQAMNRKYFILTILIACTTFFAIPEIGQALMLDEGLRPDNLPSYEFDSIQTSSEDNPESLATQGIILFIGNIVSQVLLFAAAISIIFIIVAGGTYIFAFGDDTKIDKGKRGLLWALIGLVIIMLSYAIVRGVISIILQVDVNVS